MALDWTHPRTKIKHTSHRPNQCTINYYNSAKQTVVSGYGTRKTRENNEEDHMEKETFTGCPEGHDTKPQNQAGLRSNALLGIGVMTEHF